MASRDPGSPMAREMADQPDVLAALLLRRDVVVHDVRAALPDPLAGVVKVTRTR